MIQNQMNQAPKTDAIEIEDDGTFSKINNYLIIKFLDEGSQGKVKLCQNIQTKQTYAIKIHRLIEGGNRDGAEDMRKEAESFKKIGQHPNILGFVDYFEGDYIKKRQGGTYKCICLVLEFIENGCLFDYVKAMEGFHNAISKYYLQQHVSALSQIHDQGVAHRDIKLENTLLDATYQLKICDLGFAGPSQEPTKDFIGTRSYKAPEIYLRQAYRGDKADIFSSGICFFIQSFGHYPFGRAIEQDRSWMSFVQNNASFWAYHKGCLERANKKTGFLTDSFKELLNNMLEADPEKRWNCQEILNSNYMTEQDQVQVNQKIISHNLSRYKEQVSNQRRQEAEERRKTKLQQQEQQGQQQQSSNTRAVPENLKSKIEEVAKELADDLPTELKFRKFIPVGLELSQNFLVLKPSEVIPVMAYILKEIAVPNQALVDYDISNKNCGKVKAYYKDTEEEVTTLYLQAELVDQQIGDLNVFNVSISRAEGDYLVYRSVVDQFSTISSKFREEL